MKKQLILVAALVSSSAFAMTPPSEVMDRLESSVVPAVRAGEFRITKAPRINGSGRSIPNGTCTLTSANVTVVVDYCEHTAPQAARVNVEFNDVGESHNMYVERNSQSLLPRFSILSRGNGESCVISYGQPMCPDSVWLSEASELRVLNSRSEASAKTVEVQMDLADRLERVGKAIRDYARVR